MSRPAAVTTSTCQSRVQLSTGIQGAQVGSQHHNIPPILWEGRGRPLHPEKVPPQGPMLGFSPFLEELEDVSEAAVELRRAA